jgi:hypothetical protein
MPTEIKYEERPVGDVMDYYVRGFDLKKGEEIAKYEANYDPNTGKVIFKLYITKK